MVDPILLCRKHLLGEHVECHMFRGSLHKGTSLRGFLDAGLLDSRKLARRHDQLAAEMQRRGYRHESPLPRDFDTTAAKGDVDAVAALRELATRCEECRQRHSSVPDAVAPATTHRSRATNRVRR
ncbi:MAG TPA: pyrimidine dimer DNA glycosylase/endonuclease V [Acidimicrobiales bacterium]|nr:pyrimidine dimer DNA glycosylase/endonuclease V [Acidimicrobiales bacterium]